MLIYSSASACFKHSNFFKVNDLVLFPASVKKQGSYQKEESKRQCTPFAGGPGARFSAIQLRAF